MNAARDSAASSRPEPSASSSAVEAVVWHWQARTSSAGQSSARTALWRAGLVRGLIGLGIAGLLYLRHHLRLAEVGASLSVLFSLVAMLSPTRLYPLLLRGFSRFGGWVGSLVGLLVLVPFYYLFFWPFGLLFRRGAADPLERGRLAGAKSYWKTRPPESPDIKQYERQF